MGWTRRSRPRRRHTDLQPNPGWIPTAVIALSIAGFDWTTKVAVTLLVPLGGLIPFLDGKVALWHVRNPALVLGLFGDLPLGNRMVVAALLGIAGVVLLLEVFTRSQRLLPARRPWSWVFVGLVLGGMLGNLGERVIHWWVTDFLSFRWGDLWLPPGNIADLAILLSLPLAPIIIAFEIEARRGRGRTKSAHPSRPAVAAEDG